jgi:hypothetical protein
VKVLKQTKKLKFGVTELVNSHEEDVGRKFPDFITMVKHVTKQSSRDRRNNKHSHSFIWSSAIVSKKMDEVREKTKRRSSSLVFRLPSQVSQFLCYFIAGDRKGTEITTMVCRVSIVHDRVEKCMQKSVV